MFLFLLCFNLVVIIKDHVANHALDFFAILLFTSGHFLYLRSGIVNCMQLQPRFSAFQLPPCWPWGTGEYRVASGRTKSGEGQVLQSAQPRSYGCQKVSVRPTRRKLLPDKIPILPKRQARAEQARKLMLLGLLHELYHWRSENVCTIHFKNCINYDSDVMCWLAFYCLLMTYFMNFFYSVIITY